MSRANTNTEASFFHCPITKQKFREPVVAEDGYTYERDALVKWLKDGSGKSPMTQQPINANILIPNRLVKELINAEFEATLGKQNYQYKLDVDVKQLDHLFVKYGKSVDAAEWIQKQDGSPITLMTISGAQALKEAAFFVEMSKHAHIVRTYGLVDNPFDEVMLVQERAKYSDLLQLLRRRGQPPSEDVLTEIFIQIADGMSFLAHNNIVHGDLACRNILVFEFDEQNPRQMLVKVADFGLSRGSSIYKSTSTSASTTLNVVPYRYAAPEILQNSNLRELYTEKSDMYSMGVLMWETYSPRGKQPWAHIVDDMDVMRRVIRGERLQQPATCSEEMWSLLQATMSQKPNDRPTFAALHRDLIEFKIETAPFVSLNVKKALQGIKNNSETISLFQTGLCDSEIKIIAEELKANKSVHWLNLHTNHLSNEGAAAIAELLEVNSTINRVSLTNNKISSEGAARLARALRTNQTLLVLEIDMNPLQDEGIQAICEALKTNKTLRTLWIYQTNISIIGVKLIAEMLRVSTTLYGLHIGYNNITDDGAKFIASALKINTSLNSLDMNGNDVADEGALALAEAIEAHPKIMEHFCLFNDPPISDKTREAIKASLGRNVALNAPHHFPFRHLWNASS